MKGLACPCPALPHFWQLGAPFMAESSGTQAPGQGPSVSIQFLRAQYEGLRRQQRTQAHLLVLPKGGSSSPAESMISAVWINKERSSLPPEEPELGLEGKPEETEGSGLQAPESLWHTHLEMHRVVQTCHQETSHQFMANDQLAASNQSLPSKGDPHWCENNQKTQPEAAQSQCHVVTTQTKAMESTLTTSIQYPPFTMNSHRSGKPAHYPFPQRKTPRISQAARNLGLYGPV